MIVPRYWSESKTKKIVDGQQFTIKRFGWSDTSEQDAKSHADNRLNDAIATLEKEGNVRRIDHKTSYNGAEGVPIREEVISKHHDVVISRNSYGALCLNTPDILFSDIDFEYEASLRMNIISFMLLFFCAFIIALLFRSWGVFIFNFIVVCVFTSTVANIIYRLILFLSGGVEKKAMTIIEKVSKENPDLHIRVYRTPMGYRVLIMNDRYCPTSDKAIKLLENLKSDHVYVQMCKNQNCFRARVSPKPWRIGVDRLKPRPGVWPIKADRLEERARWVDIYEKKSKNHASCHYLLHLGSDKVDDKAEFVRQIHDDMCKAANRELKMA